MTNKVLDMGVNAVMSLGSSFGGALVEAGAKAVEFGSEFETSMAKVSTRIDASQVDMESLQQEVLDLSDKTGVAASELGGAMYTALSAGVQMGDGGAGMMQYLESCTELAKAGFSDLDTAVSATADILRDYNLDLSDTDRVQKVLMQTHLLGGASLEELGNAMALVSPAAVATGVDVEQVGAALSVMTEQGVPAATAAEQLGRLLAALSTEGSQAQQALSSAAAGTQYAGMSFQEMMEAGLPLDEALDMMGVNADMSEEAMLEMFGSLEAGEAALSLSGEIRNFSPMTCPPCPPRWMWWARRPTSWPTLLGKS
ncbi:MAG: phage tail tape measure protein [Clostridiales bacterium]|nr:phage tail tape measure protein [Clostridiales bacterium]